MKIDFHFWLTYVLGRYAGIDRFTSEVIAWADEYTDKCTKPKDFGIQTQVAIEIFGDWRDIQIQSTVLMPFHFVPGDHRKNPRAVAANSGRSRMLVNEAIKNPIRLGIALHTFQDTWSHENFTGYKENFNSCGDFLLPNVGHTDMRSKPDLVEFEWDDPRIKEHIVNRIKFLEAAKETYAYLRKISGGPEWKVFSKRIEGILALPNMVKRIEEMKRMLGNTKLGWRQIDKKIRTKYEDEFVLAAKKHLGCVLSSL